MADFVYYEGKPYHKACLPEKAPLQVRIAEVEQELKDTLEALAEVRAEVEQLRARLE